jgi:endonuclease YncB( thermonuclease family)
LPEKAQIQKIMYNYKAKIYDVHDGDTFKANVDVGFDIQSNQTFSRDALRNLILNKEVVLRSKKPDTMMKQEKYGRYLAEVFVEDIKDPKKMLNVNQWMVENGFAASFMV